MLDQAGVGPENCCLEAPGRESLGLRAINNMSGAGEGDDSLPHKWRRLQPIRTVSEIEVDFAIFTSEPFGYQRIQGEARTMRKLGMSLRAIGAAMGVDEKTVRKALATKG